MKRVILVVLCTVAVMFGTLEVANADEQDRSMWPPRPGLALKAGGGLYHSVPCGCFDRSLVHAELAARLHFGQRWAIEGDTQRGAMMLGGRFPSQGWAIGGMVSILPHQGRWWENVSVRAGYRWWQTMGMRAPWTNGGYVALNWAVPVTSHIYIETDALAGRMFRDLPHWELGGRLGVSFRF